MLLNIDNRYSISSIATTKGRYTLLQLCRYIYNSSYSYYRHLNFLINIRTYIFYIMFLYSNRSMILSERIIAWCVHIIIALIFVPCDFRIITKHRNSNIIIIYVLYTYYTEIAGYEYRSNTK